MGQTASKLLKGYGVVLSAGAVAVVVLFALWGLWFGIILIAPPVAGIAWLGWRMATIGVKVVGDDVVIRNQFSTTAVRRADVAFVEEGPSGNLFGFYRSQWIVCHDGRRFRSDGRFDERELFRH